jgi:hypothetical protein
VNVHIGSVMRFEPLTNRPYPPPLDNDSKLLKIESASLTIHDCPKCDICYRQNGFHMV